MACSTQRAKLIEEARCMQKIARILRALKRKRPATWLAGRPCSSRLPLVRPRFQSSEDCSINGYGLCLISENVSMKKRRQSSLKKPDGISLSANARGSARSFANQRVSRRSEKAPSVVQNGPPIVGVGASAGRLTLRRAAACVAAEYGHGLRAGAASGTNTREHAHEAAVGREPKCRCKKSTRACARRPTTSM